MRRSEHATLARPCNPTPADRLACERAAEAAVVAACGHSARPSLEAFIAVTFERCYGARVPYFARQLIGLQAPAGGWLAAAGYSEAAEGALYVEQYFDRGVDALLAAHLGSRVRRRQVVEAGNLAATTPGAARRVILLMAQLLHRLDCVWVVFTATRTLFNSCVRLGISPFVLAAPDPARLPDRGASWGRYYASNPRVVAVNVPLALMQLRSRVSCR